MFETHPGSSSASHPPRPWFTMVAAWMIVFLLVWLLFRPATGTRPLFDPTAEPRAVTPRGDLAADEQATIEIFREASPSVVFVTSVERRRDYFSLNIFEIPRGAGTGFLYGSDGHVVTNFHVVQGAARFVVTLADRTEYDAEFVGAEPDIDIAVMRINAPPERLKPIAIGTSSDLLVGQKCFAIGNPFGLDQTLTTGVVSALGREITSVNGRPIRDVIQTDAAINPGNSGGPLLDSAGRLIGVNTQIASPSGASAGIGFAVPIDTVNAVVPEIIRYGKVRRPVLGVDLFNDAVTHRLKLPGPLIRGVTSGSSAESAGLRGTVFDQAGNVRQVGDIILRINGTRVRTFNDVREALNPFKEGDEVNVTVLRNDREVTVPVRLRAIP